MRILLRFLVSILLLLALAIAGLIAWPFWPVAQDRFGSEPYQAWLSDTEVRLDLPAPLEGRAFDPSIYESRFVMLAEIHGYRAVQAIDLTLVRHFAETGPARTYLAELGPDKALAFNHYLATGDEGPAASVFDEWAEGDFQWANVEFFQKLRALRDLNAQLPLERRIWFVGVDTFVNPDRLARLSAQIPPQTQPGFDGFLAVQALNAELGRMTLDRPEDAGRYDHFLENIAHVADLDPARHFYGLWGVFHGSKTTIDGFAPLAMRLNREGGTFEGSLASLTSVCIDACYNMMPSRALPGLIIPDSNPDYVYLPMSFDRPFLQRVRGVNDLKAVMGESRLSAFRMSGAGSPYAAGSRAT